MRGRVIAVPVASWDDVYEGRLTRPDGRVVAWTECAVPDGIPLLRVPGTPGSRWSIRADRSPWVQRRLRVITTERMGLGASTRLLGRGFREHADDLAAVLDHLGIERVFVKGASGAAPHILAFLARHPDRAIAATIEVGGAPLIRDEVDGMVPVNRDEWHLIQAGDRDAVREHTLPYYDALLADPVAGLRNIFDNAPPADQAVMADPAWQASIARGLREALDGNLEGWIDESFALENRWDEVDLSAITTSITWYHGHSDTAAPFSAAVRLVARIPSAHLVEIADAGHLATYHLEGQILDELLSRGG
jgi:pimeloyl-ACP methyl ester carboxylesterase